jgi:LmbE family N-acetylglucosaminyl deacetylase
LFTDAWAWRLDQERAVPAADLLGPGPAASVVVLVAHPGDETLAMGAALAGLASSGVTVHVACLSAGEAALSDLGLVERGLGPRRLAELEAACAELGVQCLDTRRWPDGSLAGVVDEAADELAEVVASVRADAVITLWKHDPLPDHRAVAAVARRVAGARPVVELPLWAVHWTDPAMVDLAMRRVAVSGADRWAKARALASYPSQTRPLRPGLHAILPQSVVTWPYECVVVQ